MKTTSIIAQNAPLILAEVHKAKHILLHCHPNPDPDSVGSALAMKWALTGMGKKVTLIAGDHPVPQAFRHFPGAADIEPKNFFEVDLAQFDLFIALDISGTNRVSALKPVVIPETLKIVVIDHHVSMSQFGAVNLIETSYPATAQILFDLFREWNVAMTPGIAANLFIGIYTDTGAFKYNSVTPYTYEVAAELAKHIPSIPQLIQAMDYSATPGELAFYGRVLNNVRTYHNDRFAISLVTHDMMKSSHISLEEADAGRVASFLNRVRTWEISCICVEYEPGLTKISFRSKDADKFNVAKLAEAFGGGGHKNAAAVRLTMTPEEAERKVVETAKSMYNF